MRSYRKSPAQIIKGKEIHLTMVKEKLCSLKDMTKIKEATDQKILIIHRTDRGLALLI